MLLNQKVRFQYKLTLDSGSGFILGETITQAFSTYSMKGEITRWSDSDKVMHIAHAGSTDGTFKEFGTTKLVAGCIQVTSLQHLLLLKNYKRYKVIHRIKSLMTLNQTS